jgi:hypothetical protein
VLSGETSAQQVIMRIAGNGLRINAALCKTAFDQSEAVRPGVQVSRRPDRRARFSTPPDGRSSSHLAGKPFRVKIFLRYPLACLISTIGDLPDRLPGFAIMNDRGAVLVEYAILLPVIVSVIFGGIDMSLATITARRLQFAAEANQPVRCDW